MTLYIYTEDEPGLSHCTGLCAMVWPPVTAPEGVEPSGEFTIIERESGTRQWAYKGMPLYTYVFDFEPGDAKGEGSDGTWHIASP